MLHHNLYSGPIYVIRTNLFSIDTWSSVLLRYTRMFGAVAQVGGAKPGLNAMTGLCLLWADAHSLAFNSVWSSGPVIQLIASRNSGWTRHMSLAFYGVQGHPYILAGAGRTFHSIESFQFHRVNGRSSMGQAINTFLLRRGSCLKTLGRRDAILLPTNIM